MALGCSFSGRSEAAEVRHPDATQWEKGVQLSKRDAAPHPDTSSSSTKQNRCSRLPWCIAAGRPRLESRGYDGVDLGDGSSLPECRPPRQWSWVGTQREWSEEFMWPAARVLCRQVFISHSFHSLVARCGSLLGFLSARVGTLSPGRLVSASPFRLTPPNPLLEVRLLWLFGNGFFFFDRRAEVSIYFVSRAVSASANTKLSVLTWPLRSSAYVCSPCRCCMNDHHRCIRGAIPPFPEGITIRIHGKRKCLIALGTAHVSSS